VCEHQLTATFLSERIVNIWQKLHEESISADQSTLSSACKTNHYMTSCTEIGHS